MNETRTTVCVNGVNLQVVPDGEICPSAYQASKVRVVHILKEPTKGEGLGPTLQRYIRNDGTVKWRLWKVTARRSYALQNGLPPWPVPDNALGAAFAATAVLNLNDTIAEGDRRPKTNMDALLEIAKIRWPQRKSRLKALRPSVVVCGGTDTYNLTRQLLQDCGELCEEHKGYMLWRDIPFIRACHPSFRGKKHSEEYEEFRTTCLAAQR